MEIPLFNDILIIFGLAIVVTLLCHRLNVPTIVGYLITGVLAGPHGLGLVGAVHEVEILAEIGVVLLLFVIGMEFSLKNLIAIKRLVLLGGSVQVVLTILVVFVFSFLFGQKLNESVFLGFLISLSSTAIILKLLQEKAQIDSPHGRSSLGILIFQDIAVVPMMLLVPFLAGAAGGSQQSLLVLAAKVAGIILLVIAGAKWIVPRLLYQIARTRNREIFLLTVVVICLAVAWITSSAGLSLALGAFLAGLVISESEYSQQAISSVLPFRDVFTSFFFVSIGMLLDLGFLYQHFGAVILVTLAVIAVKIVTGGFTALLLGFPLRTILLVGLALCQIGEFSFILSGTGVEYGLLKGDVYQLLLACTVISMAATPFIITLSPRWADKILEMKLPEKLVSGFYPIAEPQEAERRQHLVIIGYGMNGRNVAKAAGLAGIPYAIIEMNPETVLSEQAKGEPIYYGDATNEAVLEHARIKDAKIAVVAINDPAATRRITENVRKLAPKVQLIVRTRYQKEMKPLYDLGADEVIPEEFETSVEIFSRVLANYLIPRDEIEKFIAEVRSDGYEMFRSLSKDSTVLSGLKLKLPDVEMSTVRVSQLSPVVGKTLGETELRKSYGVSVLAIRRGEQILSNPGAGMLFHSDDVLFILGTPDKIAEAAKILSGV